MSFNCYCNTTGATNGAGNAYPSGKLQFIAGLSWVRVHHFIGFFCIVFYRSLYAIFFILIQQT